MHNKTLHMVAFILLAIGGLNWLLFGVFMWDVGSLIFGSMENMISRAIYILVGLAAIYEIAVHKSMCKSCETDHGGHGGPQTGGMGGNNPMA